MAFAVKGLQVRVLKTLNALLRERGLMMAQGTLVDPSIINAPSSPKGEAKDKVKRWDSALHQTRKGYQWYFRMKAPFGVDLHSRLMHSLTGAAGYTGPVKRSELKSIAEGPLKELTIRAEHLRA